MDTTKIWDKLVKIAGVGGVVYATGFLVHSAYFKMLGVNIQVLDPVALAEIAGDFVYESVRILSAGIKAWAWILVVLFILVVWYFRHRLFTKESLERIRQTKIIQTHGENLEKLIIIAVTACLAVWLVLFIVPLAFMSDFLTHTDKAEYAGPGLSLGQTIFNALQTGEAAPLLSLYRIHIYVVGFSLLILGSISVGSREKDGDKAVEAGQQTGIATDWPRYIRLLANFLVGVGIFFLPISFGTVAKQPVFPNVRVIVDPEKTANDDIYGLNLNLKTGEDDYLLYRDVHLTYLYNTRTRRVMMLNSSSIYQVEFIPRHTATSILQFVNRKDIQ